LIFGVVLVCGCSGSDGDSPGTDGGEPSRGGSGGSSSVAETGGDAGAEATGGTATGGAPATGGVADEPATGGGGGVCLEPGQDCSLAVDACCAGSTCIADFAHDLIVCAALCEVDSDCASGCCAALGNTEALVCAPADACIGECIPAGADCSLDPLGCCFGSTCVLSAYGTDCAAICAADWQCVSGCCAPLSNAQFWVCSPVEFCL
jgi:hypothetical protein